jgi:putative SOS response-associated peptidase YedK
MCSRFKLTSNAEIVAEMLEVAAPPALESRAEFAPTHAILAARLGERTGTREIARLRWGLIPHWAREERNLFNARAESLLEKPSFRDAFRSRRCLIPADGFFEWPLVDGKKRKILIQRQDRRPFAFAGLWDRWQSKTDGRVVESCTIITSQPNDFMEPIHDRMPVILSRERFEEWLSRATDPKSMLEALLHPGAWRGMESIPAP